MSEPNPLEDQSTAKGYQMDPTGDELMVTLAKADSAQQPATLIASGDITNLTIAPIVGTERVYTARTTGAGTLTITPAAEGVVASCLLLLTSSGNGTNTLTVGGSPVWADGVVQPLAPLTGETLALYVQSVAGTIHLTLAAFA